MSERSLNARAAAHESWAQTDDRTARTAPARRAFEDRFPNANARKAYFLRLALASAKARRSRKAGATESPPGVETRLGPRWNHDQRETNIGDARPDGAE